MAGFVRRAAELDADVQVGVGSAEELRAALGAYGAVRNFDPARVVEALCPLVPAAAAVEVVFPRRRGGPAVVVTLPRTRRERLDGAWESSVPVPAILRAAAAGAVEAAAEACGARVVGDAQGRVFRLWWF